MASVARRFGSSGYRQSGWQDLALCCEARTLLAALMVGGSTSNTLASREQDRPATSCLFHLGSEGQKQLAFQGYAYPRFLPHSSEMSL